MTELASANTVQASLNFLKDDPLYKTVRPYEVWLDDNIPAGLPKTNVEFELYHNIPIVDARAAGLETFSIEEQGFEFLYQNFPHQFEIGGSDAANSSPEQRQSILGYLDHMADFLCRSFDAEKAVSYDWRVRRSRNSPINKIPKIYTVPDDLDARTITIDVAHQVHADGSPNGIKKSLSYLLTEDEKADIVEGRYRLRVINVWRPLVPVVENQPLAICDRRSVQTSDWEEVEKIQTAWIEESMYLRHNEGQKWFWLSKQTMDEVTSIVVWDSANADSVTVSVPHCSFKLPEEDPSAKLRESIEVRYLMWSKL